MPPVRYFHYLFIKQLLVFSSITEKNICKNLPHIFLSEKLHFRKPEKRKHRIEMTITIPRITLQLSSLRGARLLEVLVQVSICQAAYAIGGTYMLRQKGWGEGNYSVTEGGNALQHLNISNVFRMLKVTTWWMQQLKQNELQPMYSGWGIALF